VRNYLSNSYSYSDNNDTKSTIIDIDCNLNVGENSDKEFLHLEKVGEGITEGN